METEYSEVSAFFAALGFEEIEIEDQAMSLCFEEAPDGEYVLLTDEEGNQPASLAIPLILACYTANNAFLWSASFKNAAQFKTIWSQNTTYAEKIRRIQPQTEADSAC